MNKLFFRKQRRYQNGLVQGTSGVASVAVGLIIIILVVLRFAAPGVLSMITTPLWNAGSYMTRIVGATVSRESKISLRADRDQLQGENSALTAQNAALSMQVQDLTSLLGTRTEPEKGIVAGVRARPPVAPYDVLIIDQGTTAGVILGALVEGAGGTPVGTVGEADATQSRVTLFSTRGIETSGWVGTNRIPVTLTGAGAGAFRADVPKDAGIKVGDGVYIAGHTAFPIGTVVEIESDPSSPTVRLDVRPYTNPFSLTWVTVTRD